MNRLADESVVLAHRYRVGDLVGLAQGFGYAQRVGAVYEVVALLPSDRAHFQYRLRSATEAFERVAAENQLTPRGSAPVASAPVAAASISIRASAPRARRGGRR